MKLSQRLSAAYQGFKRGTIGNLKEAEQTVLPAGGATIDGDEHLYRRYTQARRDIPPMKLERAINLSYVAYEKNPLAQRLIKVPVEAISSAGIDFKANDDRVYELWHEWWDDPISGFKNDLFGLVGRSLLIDAELTGEAIWPFSAYEYTGMLDIAYIDPINVENVKMDAGNARKPQAVVLKAGHGLNDTERVLPIARRGLDKQNFEGKVFYFPLNSSVNATRGRPTLYALIDWLDIYDSALFGDSKRWAILRSVLWDVEIQGGKVGDMLNYAEQHFPNGTVEESRVHVHNETVKVSAITPDLKANDATELSNLLRRYITSGRGMPDFMLGFSGDVGSASIREMSIPMVWMIEQNQRFVQYITTYIFACVLSKAVQAGRQLESGKMTGKVDRYFEIKPRSVFPREMVQLTSTFVQAVAGAQAAEEAGYLSRETCQEIVLNAAGQLGIEKSLDQEQETIAAEKAERKKEEAEDELDEELENEDTAQALDEQKGKDLTGMAGETMPQNKRLVQMSYVPEVYRNDRRKKFRKAWEKRRNGVLA